MPAPNTRNIAREKTTRQIITPTNVTELAITEEILKEPALSRRDQKGVSHQPIGLGINHSIIGEPQTGDAFSRGWVAYMNIGVPLVNESANIAPPIADTISYNSYVNLSSGVVSFTDISEFNLENEINWNLSGEGRLTFEASATASAQAIDSLTESVTDTTKASPNNTGEDVASGKQDAASLSFQAESNFVSSLQLALMGATGGALRTSARRSSTLSGEIPANSRIKVLTSQKRVKRFFNYSLPVTFSGTVALLFAEPVDIMIDEPNPYPTDIDRTKRYQKLVPYDFSKLKWKSKDFTLTGYAETFSSLEVEHTVYEREALTYDTAPLLEGNAV